MVLLDVYPRLYGYDSSVKSIPLSVEEDKCYVEHKFDGIDSLVFEVPNTDPAYNDLEEECEIRVSDFNVVFEKSKQSFLIKKVDSHSDFTVITCEINLDDWKKDVFIDFRKTNSTISEVINVILPTGWLVVYEPGVNLTKRTTVEEQEGQSFRCATSFTILGKVAEAYDVVFNYDVPSKKLHVISTDYFTDSGEFFRKDINMTEIGFNGDSTKYATRVYAYGKRNDDGTYVTIASVNGGKEYVEDTSYSGKIISTFVFDERYTIPQNLKKYAQSVLEECSVPVRSYTCNVIDFDDDIWLYKRVTIIDDIKKTRILHQCISYREYKNSALDTITLSTAQPDIKASYDAIKVDVDTKLAKQRSDMQTEIDSAVLEATRLITGNDGGTFIWIFDESGKPIELVNLGGDDETIETAQQVWRWNASGLGYSNNGYEGPYAVAITKDGKINASMITVGSLNAEIIKAGYMLADRIQGGTLKLGGGNNGNGVLQIFDANGNLTGIIDNTGANLKGLIDIVNGNNECTIGTTNTYVYRTVEGLIDVNLKCLNYIIKNENNVIAEHTWANDNNRLNDVTATTGSYINRILALTNQSSLPIIDTSSDLSKLCWLQETFTRDSNGGHYELIISHSWMYGFTDASFKFDKDGAWVNGNKITTSSSRRYKHNIQLITSDELDPHKLLSLKVVQYVYNNGKEQYQDTRGKTLPGFIAEDVAEIYPSAVIHDNKGKIESWDERRIIPGMLALIQEQHKTIEDLKTRLAKLENIVNNLVTQKEV